VRRCGTTAGPGPLAQVLIAPKRRFTRERSAARACTARALVNNCYRLLGRAVESSVPGAFGSGLARGFFFGCALGRGFGVAARFLGVTSRACCAAEAGVCACIGRTAPAHTKPRNAAASGAAASERVIRRRTRPRLWRSRAIGRRRSSRAREE